VLVLDLAGRDVLGLWDQRQGSDADPLGLDHDNAAGVEVLLEVREVRRQQRDLIARSVCWLP
jgi:hypothetical protein